MPFLPALSVVFVGIVGGNDKVARQIQTVIETAHVERTNVSPAMVRMLARHGEGSRELVERLHVDGVIGGEIVADHGRLSLHLVIYDGRGTMRSYNEIAMAGRTLTRDELDVMRGNIVDEAASLTLAASKQPKVRPQAAAAIATPERRPARKAAAKAGVIADPFANPEIEMEPPPVAGEPHETAPTATAEAVSVAELEALTSGGAAVDAGASEGISATTAATETLHLAVEIGVGVAGRSFSPSLQTVPAYSSSPIGAIRVAAHVQPTERTRVDVSFERTTSMTTPLSDGMAATEMSRWEVAGSYAMVHDRTVDVRMCVGLGRRAFAIDSVDPSRSPDSDYTYVIAGAAAALQLGDRVTLEGNLALEPVVGGADLTASSFGAASRWALDAGIAAEIRPHTHVFVRAALDYQRFSWSWDAAGARGQGGAVDGYPSGMLSLGAHY